MTHCTLVPASVAAVIEAIMNSAWKQRFDDPGYEGGHPKSQRRVRDAMINREHSTPTTALALWIELIADIVAQEIIQESAHE